MEHPVDPVPTQTVERDRARHAVISLQEAWTLEEACRNAYPARELLLDGWLLRAAGGRSRRTNSLNPLPGGGRDLAAVMPRAETIYASLGRPAMVRVPDLGIAMDAVLDRSGYGREGETRTLYAEVAALRQKDRGDLTLGPRPSPEWRQAWAALNTGVSRHDVEAFHASLAALLLPAVFALRTEDGEPAALGYGVIDRGILVIESVVTDRRRRRRGHGRRLLEGLVGAAGSLGATGACLQVADDNAPALALYRSLGFSRTVYTYHYRVQPVG